MAKLFGRNYSRQELCRRVGDIRQIAGIRTYELSDGKARGVRAADFRTGTGFRFSLLADRGLDISHVEYKGRPLAWISPTEEAAPAYFQPEGLGFLRTFYAGLLTTCGLTYCGAPCEDQGEPLGLHGRISHTPAYDLAVDQRWEGDEYHISLSGKLREAAVFQENLELRRKVSARLGESRLLIEDEVENLGYKETPFMLLYHINLGFPLVDEGARLISPAAAVKPRDEEAQKGKDEYASFPAPVPGYAEQVFYHEMKPDSNGFVNAAIVNEAFPEGPFGVYVTYPKSELPRFVEWKMVGEGEYVVGMEPANCLVAGRATERRNGTLQFLKPGEVRRLTLEIGVLDGEEPVADFKDRVAAALAS
jgi:galactose mutarotase-like enzyme